MTDALAETKTLAAGMVALPASDVPLQIFEARYRVLFSTLLAGEEGCAPVCLCFKNQINFAYVGYFDPDNVLFRS